MFDMLKKGVALGLGLGLMSKEKIEEFAKSMSDEAKLSQEEGKKFFDDLLKQSEKAKTEVEDKINVKVADALEKMGVATEKKIAELEERIKALEEK